jgi:hypothetical protein
MTKTQKYRNFDPMRSQHGLPLIWFAGTQVA